MKLFLLFLVTFVAAYDYVIIGLGTSGSASIDILLNEGKSVLVLERGQDETQNEGLEYETYNSLFTKDTSNVKPIEDVYTYDPFSEKYNYAAGGGLAVTASVWTRPDERDITSWNFPTWNHSVLVPWFRYFENYSNIFNPNETSTGRGHFGPIKVAKGVLGNMNINKAFMQTLNVTLNTDINDDTPLRGLGVFDRPLGHNPNHPEKQSLYRTKLKDSCDPNLRIELGAYATELILDHHGTVKRVKYVQDGIARSVYTYYSKVILSAGVVNSAKLLMLSGIGNCSKLSELGIKCSIDLPEIGKNLRDHAFINALFLMPGLPLEEGSMLGAFLNSPFTDPSGPVDTEIAYKLVTSPGVPYPILFVLGILLEQKSPGYVELLYNDAFRYPKIYTGHNVTDERWSWYLDKIRESISLYTTISGFPSVELAPGPNAIISDLVQTEWHGAGPCSGGLNPYDLRVLNSTNLYVFDSCAHPFPTRTHPNQVIRAVAAEATVRGL